MPLPPTMAAEAKEEGEMEEKRLSEIEALRAELQAETARRSRAETALARVLDEVDGVTRELAEKGATLAEADRADDDRARVLERVKVREPTGPRTMAPHVGARRLALRAMEAARWSLERTRAEALARFGILPATPAPAEGE